MTGMDFSIDFDFDAFEEASYEAAHEFFSKIQRDRSSEVFYTFNFMIGDVTQYFSICANTEEELERNSRKYLNDWGTFFDGVPLEDVKTYFRHQPFIFLYSVPSELGRSKRLDKVNGMLSTQSELIQTFSRRRLKRADENRFYSYVEEAYDDRVVMALKNVLRKLDKADSFTMTNRRENVHLGVLSSSALECEPLLGPFDDINPPLTCQRYQKDADAFRRVYEALS